VTVETTANITTDGTSTVPVEYAPSRLEEAAVWTLADVQRELSGTDGKQEDAAAPAKDRR
jgi:hypothetical protein